MAEVCQSTEKFATESKRAIRASRGHADDAEIGIRSGMCREALQEAALSMMAGKVAVEKAKKSGNKPLQRGAMEQARAGQRTLNSTIKACVRNRPRRKW